MPTIDLTDDELAAVTATVRRAIEDDKFPHGPAARSAVRGAGEVRRGGEANPASGQSCQARSAINAR